MLSIHVYEPRNMNVKHPTVFGENTSNTHLLFAFRSLKAKDFTTLLFHTSTVSKSISHLELLKLKFPVMTHVTRNFPIMKHVPP